MHQGGLRLPRGCFDAVRQLGLFASAYYTYNLVRGYVDGQVHVAFENARTLLEVERALGLFFEPALQAWALGSSWAGTAAGWAYVNTHFVITTAFLVWLYLARNSAFYYVRNTFMVAMGLALVVYTAFPTAPPRYMPEWGFTDTVANLFGEGVEHGAVDALYNPFAAVPSMHVAFALMIAVPAVRLVRTRAAKVAWALYPLWVTFVVVATGNHWWLDAALGAIVAAVAAYTAHAWLARARPDLWAWDGPVGAEAAA